MNHRYAFYLLFAALLLGAPVASNAAWRLVLPLEPATTEICARDEMLRLLSQTATRLLADDGEITEIHLGDTPLAKSLGLTRTALKPDAFSIRKEGHALVINGGGTRGVLYGVYAFLEEECDIRFYSPVLTILPTKREIKVSGKPCDRTFHFEMRDLYYGQFPKDGGRFAVSRGLSRDGNRPITPSYGGAFDYGPPYSCHTFDRYLPASRHLKDHPEWYSLRKGERVGGQTKGQLCLSNPEMRKTFLELLLKNIRETAAKSKAAGMPSPLIYDVSQNDNGAFCECPDCKALRDKENNSGHVLEFVNFLAGKVREEFPEIRLQTFAYQGTLPPPKTLTAAPNVIVRLCNTTSDRIRGPQEDGQFRKALESWKQIAQALYIWDYSIVYGECTGLPMPSEFSYPGTYQLYAENAVTGMFWEIERPDIEDMWELKYFLHSKYMQNPLRTDFDALLTDFCQHCYGPAGQFIEAWRRLLHKAASIHRPHLGWVPTTGDYNFITWPVMQESQRLFAEARKAAGTDKELLYLVNRAALGLDRLLGYESPRRFLNEFAASGNDRKNFPIDLLEVRRRFRRTWEESCRRNGPPTPKARETLTTRLDMLDAVPIDYPDAPEFAGIPHLDFTPGEMPLVLGREMKILPDSDSPIGVALVVDADSNRKTYGFPMTFGVYNKEGRKGITSRVFPKEEFQQDRYQWVKVHAKLHPTESCYLWLTNSWKVQIPLDNIKPLDRSKVITAHIHVKFTGDLYYGDGKPSRIFINRVVLTQEMR